MDDGAGGADYGEGDEVIRWMVFLYPKADMLGL